MELKRINHIGILVNDIEKSIETYKNVLDMNFDHREYNEDFDCEIAFFNCGGILVELIQPFERCVSYEILKTQGEGINHICYEVDDIDSVFSYCKENGLTEYESVKSGAGGSKVFFLNQEKVCNVSTEIVSVK